MIRTQGSVLRQVEAKLALGCDGRLLSTIGGGALVELLTPSPTLLVVGAGHCGMPLAQIAHWAGFRLWVQDNRPSYMTPDRFLPPAEPGSPF